MGTVFEQMSSWTALTSRDENNILDQIYKSKYVCSDFYFDGFKSLLHYSKRHTNTKVGQKPNFMSFLLLCTVFLLHNMHFPQSL